MLHSATNSLVPKTRRKKVSNGGLGCPQSRKAKPQLSLLESRRRQEELLFASQKGWEWSQALFSFSCTVHTMPRASNQAVSSRQAGQIHVPSFSQQDSLVFRNRCHLPLTCHRGGEQAARCHFRSVQRCMQAVSMSHNRVPCVTPQAPDTQCFISVTSPSQFSISQSNKS